MKKQIFIKEGPILREKLRAKVVQKVMKIGPRMKLRLIKIKIILQLGRTLLTEKRDRLI